MPLLRRRSRVAAPAALFSVLFRGRSFSGVQKTYRFRTFVVPITEQGEPDTRKRERYDLFAVMEDGRGKEGWISIHLLLWKQVIAALVRVDTEEEVFAPHQIWYAAWRRFKKRALALQENKRTKILRAESRGPVSPRIWRGKAKRSPLSRVSIQKAN